MRDDEAGRLTRAEWWQNAGALVWLLISIPCIAVGIIGLLSFLLGFGF